MPAVGARRLFALDAPRDTGKDAAPGVVVLTDWFPTVRDPVGGIFVRDQALAAATITRLVLLLDDADGAAGDALTEGTGLRVQAVRRRRWRPSVVDTAMRVLHTARAVRNLRYGGFQVDVLHAHEFFAAGLVAVLVGRLLGIPVVVSEHHGDFVERRIAGRDALVARFVFRNAAVVCPVSDVLACALREFQPAARLCVVPNVVDVKAFETATQRRERPTGAVCRLLFIGRPDLQKGADLLLDVAQLLSSRGADFTLDVVGQPVRLDVFRADLELRGLSGTVRVRGALSRPELAEEMRAADLLLVTSRAETFGVVIAEAVSAGLPVVATRVGIAPEILDAQAGIIVATNDVYEFTAAVERAVTRLGCWDTSASAECVRRDYSESAVALRWGAVYRHAQVSRG